MISHGAAVRGHELEHHRKPDAGAFDRSAARGAPGVEGVEDVLAILHRDARTAIGDIQHQLRPGGARHEVNRAALGGVFDGVGHQVLENQADLAAIGDERNVLDTYIQSHALRQEGELLVLQHLLHQRTQAELASPRGRRSRSARR